MHPKDIRVEGWVWATVAALGVALLIANPALPTGAEKSPADSPRQNDAMARDQEAPPKLDLDDLEQRLRNTDAIGFLTKLSLKHEIDDLLDAFRAFHKGKGELTHEQLRERYDLLLLKVVTLLQDGDPTLAQEIYAAREGLWELLLDPKTFQES